MTLLLMLSYVALCIALLKVWPLQRGRVPTVLLGGVLTALVLSLMNHYHPSSLFAASDPTSQPVLADVSGRVVEVAGERQWLQPGDRLLRLDATPFQAEIERRRSVLNDARQQLRRLQAELDTAQQQLVRLGNEQDQRIAREESSASDASGSVPVAASQDEQHARYRAIRQQWQQQIQTRQGEIERQSVLLRQRELALEQARHDRERTEIHALVSGYVSRVAVRAGMSIDAQSTRPLMHFVAVEPRNFIAAFAQHSGSQLVAGRPAELIFAALPGMVFHGRVTSRRLAQATDKEYGVPPGATPAGGDTLARSGLTLIGIELQDDLSRYALPPGLQPEIVVYSDRYPALATLRRILLRMKSWQHYLLFAWR